MGRLAPQAGSRVQRYRQQLGTLNYVSGQNSSVDLKRSEYTLSLDLSAHQQVVTGGTAPVIAGYGAFGAQNLIQVTTSGGQSPLSVSGWFLDAFNRYRLAPYSSQRTASPIATSSTNNWINDQHIPFTLTEDTERGCFYTGDPSLQMTLTLNNNPAAVAFSTVNGATIQGSWNVFREVISAPAPTASPAYLDAISWYRQLARQYTGLMAAGTTPVQLPRNRDYQNIYFVAYTGNNNDATFAPAAGLFSSISLKINDTISIYDTVEEEELLFEMAQLCPGNLPAGFYVIPFERISNSIRDILPTDGPAVTSLEFDLTTAGSTTKVDIYTETVVDSPIAAPWIQAAAQAAAGAGK